MRITAVRYGRGSPAHKSGVFIRGFPPNKKTTRQRNKTAVLFLKTSIRSDLNFHEWELLATEP